MGTVYLGRMMAGDTTRTVAIKVLHPHLANDADMVAMFLDEARVATRLRHPNLVGVLDMDMLGEELVIVMDYVEGASLGAMQSALRQRGEKLPVGASLRIVSDALAGLHEVHGLRDEQGQPLGLVHRDVSPHNLLVGTDGVTRVTDFGVALAVGRLASTRPDGTVKGKLQYLSPEQVGRKALDSRVDVFAAGIVLWECLTGERLFEALTEAETVTRVLRDPISPPSMTRPELSMELDEVCLRALERDPGRRFPTADDFAAALRQTPEGLAAASDVGNLVYQLAGDSIEKQRSSLVRVARTAPPSSAGRRGGRGRGVTVAVLAVLALAAGAVPLAMRVRRSGTWRMEPLQALPAAAIASSAAPARSSLPPPAPIAEATSLPPRPSEAVVPSVERATAPHPTASKAPPRRPGTRPTKQYMPDDL
jgi:serine/threonine-protein kinase